MVSRTETNSPGLRYVSIADSLQQQIESGEVRDGDRLPSQHEMAKQYGVSLTTLRSAVDLLEQRGYVRSAHGLGTFAQAPGPSHGSPHVLLVDDDPQVVDLLTAILEGEDLAITSASTAAEGIAKLDDSSYQAIFLDLIMPGGTGVDLLKAVERQQLKTPVVLVTGAGDTALINEAMDHGPITLIRKPVRVKQVRQVLEVLGVQKQARA
ncbi:response regulator [Candidatus Lucifugimonas marina]|uniref:Response regulator n=1 Tax=Candidatus Lucifugimonas marina TaxID=3038979 RepID=A0AAJ6CUA5_9CHLR|nr:response regulator [SAR202 cluster bacterium JH702]MDG0868459.1 response regulator [SAR202 cluster bacterium JH639]WFG35092.1 response regulator [SAR202 cluster bacterium JH545]WFG39049.1 response regulator [SAR202 cluster bacterium JH1073]